MYSYIMHLGTLVVNTLSKRQDSQATVRVLHINYFSQTSIFRRMNTNRCLYILRRKQPKKRLYKIAESIGFILDQISSTYPKKNRSKSRSLENIQMLFSHLYIEISLRWSRIRRPNVLTIG